MWITVDREPPQKTLVKVTGPSGDTTHLKFLTLAYLDDSYRPSNRRGLRWLDVMGIALVDYGWEPTHWAPFDPRELP